MIYRVEVSRRPASFLRRAGRALQERLVRRLEELGEDPYDRLVSKPLQGRLAGLRSSRVGAYRILYYVDDEVRVVDVTEIGPRGDVYKDG